MPGCPHRGLHRDLIISPHLITPGHTTAPHHTRPHHRTSSHQVTLLHLSTHPRPPHPCSPTCHPAVAHALPPPRHLQSGHSHAPHPHSDSPPHPNNHHLDIPYAPSVPPTPPLTSNLALAQARTPANPAIPVLHAAAAVVARVTALTLLLALGPARGSRREPGQTKAGKLARKEQGGAGQGRQGRAYGATLFIAPAECLCYSHSVRLSPPGLSEGSGSHGIVLKVGGSTMAMPNNK